MGIIGDKYPYFWQLSLPQVLKTEWHCILGGCGKGDGVETWEGKMWEGKMEGDVGGLSDSQRTMREINSLDSP